MGFLEKFKKQIQFFAVVHTRDEWLMPNCQVLIRGTAGCFKTTDIYKAYTHFTFF